MTDQIRSEPEFVLLSELVRDARDADLLERIDRSMDAQLARLGIIAEPPRSNRRFAATARDGVVIDRRVKLPA